MSATVQVERRVGRIETADAATPPVTLELEDGQQVISVDLRGPFMGPDGAGCSVWTWTAFVLMAEDRR